MRRRHDLLLIDCYRHCSELGRLVPKLRTRVSQQDCSYCCSVQYTCCERSFWLRRVKSNHCEKIRCIGRGPFTQQLERTLNYRRLAVVDVAVIPRQSSQLQSYRVYICLSVSGAASASATFIEASRIHRRKSGRFRPLFSSNHNLRVRLYN